MFKNAASLFEIFGFKIKVDPSWLLIAALIVWSLSTSYFPDVLPGYTRYDYIALSVVAMLGLFASLILHELSHSLVARQFGLKVGGITLFVFGGVAELEHEPRNPESEFWIAIAGPAMSFTLSAIAYAGSIVFNGSDVSKPLTEVLAYLALINLILAVFNLVPAFPLDGGRVLRAALWHFKKDLLSATRIASGFGAAFAYFLIFAGVLSIFTTQSIGGLWQILIGFFVLTASKSSYQQLLIKTELKDQTVRALMTASAWTVEADSTIFDLVNDIMLKHNVSFVPVVEGTHLLGYVDLATVHKMDRENWDTTRVADIFVAVDDQNTATPDTPTETIFERMSRTGQRKLLVSEKGELLGVISLSDLLSYLAIRQGLGLQ